MGCLGCLNYRAGWFLASVLATVLVLRLQSQVVVRLGAVPKTISLAARPARANAHGGTLFPGERRRDGASWGGCRRGVCEFGNVCHSGRDPVLLWDAQPQELQSILGNGSNASIYRPEAPAAATWQDYAPAEWIQGTGLVGHCWRQSAHRTNPAHLLFGMGHLFDMLRQRRPGGALASSFSHVILHQCAACKGWPFCEAVWRIVTRECEASGAIATPMRTIWLPGCDPPGCGKGKSKKKSRMVCSDRVVTSFSSGLYLNDNKAATADAWREVVGAFVRQELRAPWPSAGAKRPPVPPQLCGGACARPGADACPSAVAAASLPCTSALRVAVWQRSESRAFSDLPTMLSLVRKHTCKAATVVTTSPTQAILEQMRAVNSFDVFISAHGSQLANMVWTARPDPVYLELTFVWGRAEDGSLPFCANARTFLGGYIVSNTVLPEASQASLQRMFEQCRAPRGCQPAMYLKNRKRTLVVESFRNDLQLALAMRCHLDILSREERFQCDAGTDRVKPMPRPWPDAISPLRPDHSRNGS